MMRTYKTIRHVVKALKITLKQHFTHKTVERKGNMKETWKTTMHFSMNDASQKYITSLTEGDIQLHEKRGISNTMNDYFCIIFHELADETDHFTDPSYLVITSKGNKKPLNLQRSLNFASGTPLAKQKSLRALETTIPPVTFSNLPCFIPSSL